MEKLIVEGKVAILISHGYGAGWYTWNKTCKECLFDPEIIDLVLKNTTSYDIQTRAEKKYADYDFYGGGANGLVVRWIQSGQLFKIEEYDGNESIIYGDNDWIKA